MNQPPDPDVMRPTPDGPSGLAPEPVFDGGVPVRSRRRSTGAWPLIGLLAAIAAFLVGGYVLVTQRSEAPPASGADVPLAAEAPAPPAPLGGSPFPADVPPLDQSDDFVRQWVPRLSAHPRIAAWLTSDRLVRNFTTVVVNIADGATPAGHLPILKPAGAFRTMERGDALVIDPRSFTRYDALASAFASIDADAAAQLYATLKPRIEEAHAELGAPPGSFDRTLERAIVALLAVPVGDGPVAVEPSGIGYRYADERFERLSQAQRHLLRMGPSNARLVQRALRDLATALGIPAARLPARPVS